jgi:putative membrane protein
MMWVFLVLLVAAGFAAYSFIRRRGGHGFFDSEKKKEEPLEIASRRYARGEISRQEFEQIKRDLEESRKE